MTLKQDMTNHVTNSAVKRVFVSEKNEKRVENHSFTFEYEFICIRCFVIRSHSFEKNLQLPSHRFKKKLLLHKKYCFITKIKDEGMSPIFFWVNFLELKKKTIYMKVCVFVLSC